MPRGKKELAEQIILKPAVSYGPQECYPAIIAGLRHIRWEPKLIKPQAAARLACRSSRCPWSVIQQATGLRDSVEIQVRWQEEPDGGAPGDRLGP